MRAGVLGLSDGINGAWFTAVEASITSLPQRGHMVDVDAESQHRFARSFLSADFLDSHSLAVRFISGVGGHSSVGVGNLGLSIHRVSRAISNAERPRCDLRVIVRRLPSMAASVVVFPSFGYSEVRHAMTLVLCLTYLTQSHLF
mgnify:CR=1 FL=1